MEKKILPVPIIVFKHVVTVLIFVVLTLPFIASIVKSDGQDLDLMSYLLFGLLIAISEWVIIWYSTYRINKKYIITNTSSIIVTSTVFVAIMIGVIVWYFFAMSGGSTLPFDYFVVFIVLTSIMYIATTYHLEKG